VGLPAYGLERPLRSSESVQTQHSCHEVQSNVGLLDGRSDFVVGNDLNNIPFIEPTFVGHAAVCGGFLETELREEYLCYRESVAGLRLCHLVACS
jgi:hypothetical protein